MYVSYIHNSANYSINKPWPEALHGDSDWISCSTENQRQLKHLLSLIG